MRHRFLPTPGYRYQPQTRILPRPDYKPPSMHTRALPEGSMAKAVDAEWCPICLGRRLSEKVVAGRPMWLCEDCGHTW